MIKEDGNEKKNGKGFFEKRLLIGAVIIVVGILVVFLDILSTFAFQVFAILFLLLPVIVVGSIELRRNLIKSRYAIEGVEDIYPKTKELFKLVTLGVTGVMWVYFYLSILLIVVFVLGENSLGWFLLILAPPGAFDGIAFVMGKMKGKHKIKALRNISPNKTWEGTIFGTIACIILALIILVWRFSYLEFWQILVTALVISVCAFLGDLVESKYKRMMAIKDSGTFMRGHGGILDRIDSQLLTAYGIFLLRIFWFL